MKSIWHQVSSTHYPLPKEEALKNIVHSFSPAERVLLGILSIVCIVSSLILLNRVNHAVMVEVPASGGSLIEGIIGTPRFINPLLAISDADKDLSALVYSGLLRVNEAGDVVTDLAEAYDISDDGLVYTVILKRDATFHNGKAVTADDVVYTTSLAQDPTLKSPRRANWDGVSIAKVDERTVTFTLKQPYAPFLENLTIGILPEHLWSAIDPNEFPFSELNVEPIGSGPYKVKNVVRNSSGIPIAYDLVPFNDSTTGLPYISLLRFKFYENEAALIRAYNNSEVESVSGLSPENLRAITRSGGVITASPLPRVFGLFLNQNQNAVFADKNVRAALNMAVNKERIVNQVLQGYGTAIDSPFPPGTIENIPLPKEPGGSKEAALTLLGKAGWKKDAEGRLMKGTGAKAVQMKFAIATPNTPELKAATEFLKQDFTDLGIDATVKVFEPGDLSQNVIRPRDYEALFFGEVVGREFDLFAFWHSSQRIDPGLNIALYANITADRLLEAARVAEDPKNRESRYIEFDAIFRSETPAIMVYAPEFIYIVPEKLRGSITEIGTGSVTTPGDRFNGVAEWYIDTEWVWPFFEKINIRKILSF